MNKDLKNYYNECLFILLNYHKIKNNPHTKVRSLSKSLFIKEIVLIVLIIVTIGLYYKTKYIPCLMVTFFILIVLGQNIYTLILVKGRIKSEIVTKVDKKIDSKVQPKKNEIVKTKETKDSNNKKVKVVESTTKWDDILYIIINKYSICYLPKKDASKIICTPIGDQEKVLKDVDKYNRRDLLIDNSDLYK